MMFNTHSHKVASLIVLYFKFNKTSVTRTQKDMQLSAIQCVTCICLLYSVSPASVCYTVCHLHLSVIQCVTCICLLYSVSPASVCYTVCHLHLSAIQCVTCICLLQPQLGWFLVVVAYKIALCEWFLFTIKAFCKQVNEFYIQWTCCLLGM